MKTYAMKASEVKKDWYVIDATDLVLGRLSAIAASYLRGKHKPSYSPSMDAGDNIIIVNAEKVHLTGRKLDEKHGKRYFWHTGYFGGIKETVASKIIGGKFPARVLEEAIRRMLGKNKMGYQHMKNLYIYAGPTHLHEAQKPQLLDIAAMNVKNSKRS
jgi:large subunit ribosomal protein L13